MSLAVRKLRQVELTSKAAHRPSGMPSRRCRSGAVAGMDWYGTAAAKISRSTSVATYPAAASARRAASSARFIWSSVQPRGVPGRCRCLSKAIPLLARHVRSQGSALLEVWRASTPWCQQSDFVAAPCLCPQECLILGSSNGCLRKRSRTKSPHEVSSQAR